MSFIELFVLTYIVYDCKHFVVVLTVGCYLSFYGWLPTACHTQEAAFLCSPNTMPRRGQGTLEPKPFLSTLLLKWRPGTERRCVRKCWKRLLCHPQFELEPSPT